MRGRQREPQVHGVEPMRRSQYEKREIIVRPTTVEVKFYDGEVWTDRCALCKPTVPLFSLPGNHTAAPTEAWFDARVSSQRGACPASDALDGRVASTFRCAG
jgi:hypothetical protein